MDRKREFGNLLDLESSNELTRGWVMGAFVPDSTLRHDKNVEIKFITLEPGTSRESFTSSPGTKLFSIVLEIERGAEFIREFTNPEETITLKKKYDYAVFTEADETQQHKWICRGGKMTLLIVRWKT